MEDQFEVPSINLSLEGPSQFGLGSSRLLGGPARVIPTNDITQNENRDNRQPPSAKLRQGRQSREQATKNGGWLIYHQSECQEEEIFVNFPCASESVSCQ